MYRIGLCWVSLFRDRIACLCSQNVGITDVCSPSSSKVHTLSYNQAPAILCLKNRKPLCWLNNSLPMDLYQSIQPLSCCDWLISLSRVFSLFLLYLLHQECSACGCSVCASILLFHSLASGLLGPLADVSMNTGYKEVPGDPAFSSCRCVYRSGITGSQG